MLAVCHSASDFGACSSPVVDCWDILARQHWLRGSGAWDLFWNLRISGGSTWGGSGSSSDLITSIPDMIRGCPPAKRTFAPDTGSSMNDGTRSSSSRSHHWLRGDTTWLIYHMICFCHILYFLEGSCLHAMFVWLPRNMWLATVWNRILEQMDFL